MAISILLLFMVSCSRAQKVESNWESQIRNYTREAIRGAWGRVLFEYDMLLPFKHVKSAVNNGTMKLTGDWKWEKGIIPYKIQDRLRCKSKLSCILFWKAEFAIKAAMAEWENETCIKFVKATDKHKDYVLFKSNDHGICASHIGRIGGPQRVLLGRFCRNKGSLLHQIGHVIGLLHEQSRIDRNDSITIKWTEIKKHKWYNYQTYVVEQVPWSSQDYDTKSIMHFGTRPLDRNLFRKQILPRVGGISRWKTLRKTDTEKVNALYKEECYKRLTVVGTP